MFSLTLRESPARPPSSGVSPASVTGGGGRGRGEEGGGGGGGGGEGEGGGGGDGLLAQFLFAGMGLQNVHPTTHQPTLPREGNPFEDLGL